MSTIAADKYDVIIIGAGLAGLTCAGSLSRKGKKVMLVEKHMALGGYCTSFSRKGYTFDSCDHFVNGVGNEEILNKVFRELGVLERIKFVKPYYSETLLFTDYKYKVPNEIENFREKLLKDFPEQKDSISTVFEILGILGGENYDNPVFRQYYMMPYEELLRKHISDPYLFNIFAGGYAYVGNIRCPAVLMAYLLGNAKYYPVGGMQQLSNTIMEIIRENNGQILLNSRVSNIITNEKKAEGIKLDSGEEYYADKIVSAIDAKITYTSLVDKDILPKRFKESIKSYRPSLSSFVLYLGVDKNLESFGFDDSLICIYDDIGSSNFMNQDMGYSPYSDVKRICVSMLGQKYEQRKKNQKQSIMANCFAPFEIEGGWKKNKQKMIDNVLKRLTKLIPGIENSIEVIEAATPETLERYTANYQGGSYGYDRTVEQTRLFHRNYSPPIKNLYHIGHSAGGFYCGLAGSAVSGYNIACKIADEN